MVDTALLASAFGFAAALLWGVGDFAAAKGARQVGPFRAATMSFLLNAILYAIIYFWFLRTEAVVDTQALIYATAGALANALALAFFFWGLAAGPVSIVSPLSSLYPLATTLILLGFFHHSLSPLQLAGIGLVVVGASMAAGLFSQKHRFGKGPLLGLAAACSWGIGFAMLSQSTSTMGWQLAQLLHLCIGATAILGLWVFIERRRGHVVASAWQGIINKNVLANGVLSGAALLAVNIGLGIAYDLSAVTIAISSCYPILTVFLALTRLKEKVQLVPLVGGMAGVVGILILALG
jgi:drug/metabolite transporter (DMT)-like permease